MQAHDAGLHWKYPAANAGDGSGDHQKEKFKPSSQLMQTAQLDSLWHKMPPIMA